MMQCRTEFADDGSLNTLMFVPEEMKAEAAEHGVVVREDGYAVIESTTWKEENGKFYYDTKTEGEVFGEKVDPFAESVCGDSRDNGWMPCLQLRNDSSGKSLNLFMCIYRINSFILKKACL